MVIGLYPVMNTGCSWHIAERLENGFFMCSQFFPPMFHMYKYIAVDSHV